MWTSDEKWESDLSWGDSPSLNFVNRGKTSSKIIDFSTQEKTRETMRFGVVDSLDFTLPKVGESLFILTSKPISLLDVVNYISQQEIEEAIMYLFTVNAVAVNYIVHLAKSVRLKLIISDIMNTKREKENLITEVLDNGNVEYLFVHSHAKVISLKMKSGDYYNLVGSMNAGSNAKIENLQIINSAGLYDFIDRNYCYLKENFKVGKR